MRLSFIKPGLLTTVQDLGRYTSLNQGVPISGAMDPLSAQIANVAVGNPDNEAVIEFTYSGAQLLAETDLLIAISGEGAIFKAGLKELPIERPVYIPQGTVIKLENNPYGSRSYMAVSGGCDVPDVLGSKSTYLTASIGGIDGRIIQAGDLLNSRETISPIAQKIIENLKSDVVSFPTWGLAKQLLHPGNRKNIRVVPAHEFTWFDSRSIVDFLTTPYTLGLRSNRMGYQLHGAVISQRIKHQMLSTAVMPGTIQATGNGSLILLMADSQTTGGYPRIAQVASVDMPLCAQLKPGDEIFFNEISRQEAEMLFIKQEKGLQMFAIAIKNKFL